MPLSAAGPGADFAGLEGYAKKTTGGGSPGTGGGTTTSTGGGSTPGTGGTGSTSTGTTGATSSFKTVTTLWQTLTPPTGDSGTPTDTNFAQQWNLTSITAGIDVLKSWQNYTGLGVKVGVIDDGIDYNHPDLNQHYLFNLDYDATNGGSDAYGLATDYHGTTVAGVLAAARDGSNVVGVAYNPGIAGFRIS